MDAEWWRMQVPGGAGRHRGAAGSLGRGGDDPRRQPGRACWLGMSFSSLLWRLGTEDQKKWARWMVEKQLGSTMVLTEPDAGTDVGAGRSKGIRQPDGSWDIEGVKRFITAADYDSPENIVHNVLARPEGAQPGTKGLSMFIVPKFRVTEDRSLRRAQRRLRHQHREEDGPQGLHRLRS